MKIFALLSVLFILSVSADKCGKKEKKDGVYKARLEIKALCMNYTIKVLDEIDTALVEENWTDEHSGKSYEDVFALGSVCSFPDSIKQGDEFYFRVDTSGEPERCAVCMAYYPKPSKSLAIKVVNP